MYKRQVKDGVATVVYRSFSHTITWSEKRNREQVYHKGISFLPRMVEALYQRGEAAIASEERVPLVGEAAALHVMRYATCTRTSCHRSGRVTDLIWSGKMFSDLGIARLSPATDRVMVCGSLPFIHDMQAILNEQHFIEGSNAAPADFVVEKAFVG